MLSGAVAIHTDIKINDHVVTPLACRDHSGGRVRGYVLGTGDEDIMDGHVIQWMEVVLLQIMNITDLTEGYQEDQA